MLNLVNLFICLLLTLSAHASPIVSGDSDHPITKDQQIRELRLSVVREFRDPLDRQIPRNSRCEEVLVRAQEKGDVVFNHAQIAELLNHILNVTNEQLEETRLPSGCVRAGGARFSGPTCFTAHMRVRTPSGFVPIGQLQVGQPVLSLDLDTQTVVPNRIQKIIRSTGRPVTLLETPHHLEVTEDERFLLASGDYMPLKQIGIDTFLQRALIENQTFLLENVRRGQIQPASSERAVFNLTLENEPRNFIVEEMVVHNIKAKF